MKEHIFKKYLENILNHLDIIQDDFFEESKKREVVMPRQMLYYLCREKANMQFTEIKSYLSKQGFEVALDTIIYGSNSFKKILEEDMDYMHITKKISNIDNLEFQENSTYNFCPSCLKQIIVPGNFCTNCGNKLI